MTTLFVFVTCGLWWSSRFRSRKLAGNGGWGQAERASHETPLTTIWLV